MVALGRTIPSRWERMNALLTQAARFGAVGILNTSIGLSIIWLSMALGVNIFVANAIGYSVGLVISFTLNRTWTFGTETNDLSESKFRQALRFICIFLVSWLCNISVVLLGLEYTDLSPYLLQLLGIITYTVQFFILCRIWVFAPRAP